MSPVDISVGLAIGLGIGIFLTLTIIMVKNKLAQTAFATGGSQITQKQAGRDVVDIGTYAHTQTQLQYSGDFLAQGEQLAIAKDLDDFTNQVRHQWAAATEYVFGVSLYGRPFMPPEPDLEELIQRGVQIRMILIDPTCPATKDIVEDKVHFSRAIQQYEIFSKAVGLPRLDNETLLRRITQEVSATIGLLQRLKEKHPRADVGVKLIDFLPVWKGTIVDGASAVYLVYDVPRIDVPFRQTENRELIKFYEDHYFHPYWKQGTIA